MFQLLPLSAHDYKLEIGVTKFFKDVILNLPEIHLKYKMI
jgi:hypothetical protein